MKKTATCLSAFGVNAENGNTTDHVQQTAPPSATNFRKKAVWGLSVFLFIMLFGTHSWATPTYGSDNCSFWLQTGNKLSARVGNTPSIATDATGAPWVIFQDSTNGGKVNVMKYTGSAWSQVGTSSLPAGAYGTSIAFNSAGTIPFIAYRDSTNSNKITVKKYSGSSWVTVGNAGFSPFAGDSTVLAVDGTGTPYVAYLEDSAIAGVKAVRVMKFNGSTWDTLGPRQGFEYVGASVIIYNIGLKIGSGNTPYLVYNQYGGFGYSFDIQSRSYVMKYTGGAWVQLGGSFDNSFFPSMVISASGTPYIAYNQTSSGVTDYKVHIQSFDGTSWNDVGVFPYSSSSFPEVERQLLPTMGINNSGQPYVAFSDFNFYPYNYLYCYKYDGTTWDSVGRFAFIMDSSQSQSMVISSSGKPFVVAQQGATANVVVYELDPFTAGPITGPSNVAVGATILLSDTSGGIWSNGNTLIAYVDSLYTPGSVYGVANGTTTVSYTAYYNNFSHGYPLWSPTCISVATKVITVGPPTPLNPITGNLSVCSGSASTLSNSNPGGTWISGSTGVATIGLSSGVVIGGSVGTSIITYTASTGATATAIVTVTPGPGPISGPTSVCLGSAVTLSVSFTGGTWSSVITSVASVNTSGAVTGLNTGNATIQYSTPSGCISSYIVTVNPGAVAYTGPTSVCQGSTVTMTESGGGTWATTSSSIGSVNTSTGVFTGVTAGSVTVTYTLSTGCSRNISMVVNALPAVITGVTSVCPGATTNLYDATTPANSWTSSNTAVATILANGVTTGVTSGTSIITYTMNGGCQRTTTLTVLPVPQAIGGNVPVCAGSAITLTDTGTGTWASANTAIATISAGGIFTGQAGGSTAVSYTAPSGCRTTTTVTVNPIMPITGTTTACSGTTTTLSDATTGGTWSTTDVSFATVVSGTGVVTGVSAGTANITYTTPGSCKRSVVVTVNAFSLITGASSVCQGITLPLSDLTVGGTWSSQITSVATVNATTGLVTPINTGNTTITYTAPNSCKSTKAITINALPGAISGSSSICASGGTTTLSSAGGGTWTSGDNTIATAGLNTGVITGVGAGSVSIIYTLGTGCARGFNVTVKAIAGITGALSQCMGTANTLHDATTPSNSWTSSNSAVATILANGVITTVGAGTTTIIYTGNNCPISAILTINPAPAAGVISGAATVATSAIVPYTSSGTAGGTWTVSNAHALVDVSGNVTGVSAGAFVLSYAVTNSCGTATATKNITESGPAPADHGSSNNTIAINTGSTLVLTTESATDGSWSSSDNTIATVDANGVITGIAPGSVRITHSSAGNADVATSTTSVVVNALPMEASISPNPNKGTFAVRGTTGATVDQAVEIEITDMLGRVVYKNIGIATGGTINEQVSLSGIVGNGTYLLTLHSGNDTRSFHFIME